MIDTFIAPPCNEVIEFLYQDSDLLVISKPSGLLTLSGKNPCNLDSVHYRLVKKFSTALMIHRLDFGTSGLLVVALNKEIAKALNRQFQLRAVSKVYEAVLNGCVDEITGTIECSIAKDAALFPRLKVCSISGKQAITDYKVLSINTKEHYSRVEFTPITGRTHQLRIHSRELGHPILGCDLYGTPETQDKSKRLMLHAKELHFTHPVSGKKLAFVSPTPF